MSTTIKEGKLFRVMVRQTLEIPVYIEVQDGYALALDDATLRSAILNKAEDAAFDAILAPEYEIGGVYEATEDEWAETVPDITYPEEKWEDD